MSGGIPLPRKRRGTTTQDHHDGPAKKFPEATRSLRGRHHPVKRHKVGLRLYHTAAGELPWEHGRRQRNTSRLRRAVTSPPHTRGQLP